MDANAFKKTNKQSQLFDTLLVLIFFKEGRGSSYNQLHYFNIFIKLECPSLFNSPFKAPHFQFLSTTKANFMYFFLTFHFWRFSKWLWTQKKGEIDGWLASNRVEKSKYSERDIITLSRWWRFDFNFWGLLKEFSKCSLASSSSSSWWWNYGWSTFSMKGGRKFIMKLLRKIHPYSQYHHRHNLQFQNYEKIILMP